MENNLEERENKLKCPACGHECPLTDKEGKVVIDPICPCCARISKKRVSMVEIDPEGMVVGALDKAPVLTGQHMHALMYLLVNKVGLVEIPQEVFDTVPDPSKMPIERQWDDTNKMWRFFIKRTRKKSKPKLFIPNKGLQLN